MIACKPLILGLFLVSINQVLFTQEIIYADTFALKYECSINQSVKYFPELKNQKICFKVKRIKTTASCAPVWYTLFRKKEKRVYRICINNNEKKIKSAILNYAPFTAQVGVIGHELAHITDYSQRNFFGVVGLGVSYIFIKGRKKTEQRVDCITIQHGLGEELWEFTEYIFSNPDIPEKYKTYKRKVYNSPDDLKNIIASGTCSN